MSTRSIDIFILLGYIVYQHNQIKRITKELAEKKEKEMEEYEMEI